MLLTIALVHLAAVISPGANFLVVSTNALTYSRRSGLITARGVALGSLIYIVIGLLGFATIISHSPALFNLIRIAGAVYFVRTGIVALASLWQRTERAQAVEPVVDLTGRQAFNSGLLTALSNPTSVLYFLALFTTFIDVSTPPGEKALTALVLIAISLTWYTILALTFSYWRVRLIYARFERWLRGLIGILWLLLAARLLLA